MKPWVSVVLAAACGLLGATPTSAATKPKPAEPVPITILPTAPKPPAPRRFLDDLTIDYETGALYVVQNDQRYGANGTFYTRSTVAQDRNLIAVQRVSAEARFADRHTVIFLYAPLDVSTRVTLDAPFTFRDTTFSAGRPVVHRYLFDGIRATYLYRFFENTSLKFDGGATLGVRNAEVSMLEASGDRFAAERDIGPVPALRGRLRYDAPNGLYALYDMDWLYTPNGLTGGVRGGVVDTALTFGLPLQRGLDAFLRLRYLAGGAEVTSRDIFNWGQFVSATAGIRFSPTAFWDPAPRMGK